MSFWYTTEKRSTVFGDLSLFSLTNFFLFLIHSFLKCWLQVYIIMCTCTHIIHLERYLWNVLFHVLWKKESYFLKWNINHFFIQIHWRHWHIDKGKNLNYVIIVVFFLFDDFINIIGVNKGELSLTFLLLKGRINLYCSIYHK